MLGSIVKLLERWRSPNQATATESGAANGLRQESLPSASQAQVFYNTASEKFNCGNFELAIPFYDEAIKLDPNNTEMLLSRATAYRLSTPSKLDAALRDTDKAIHILPGSWNAWHARGEVLLASADLDAAEEAFQNALERAPRMNQLQAQSSLAYIREKRAAGKIMPKHKPPSTMISQTETAQSPALIPLPEASQPGAGTARGPVVLPENVPSDPPPRYSAEPNPSPRRSTLTIAYINDRLQSLGFDLAPRNKGRLKVKPYKSTHSIKAVRLVYVGMTNLELTSRELSTPTYLHESQRKWHVDEIRYPGNTFLDMDCETSARYAGKFPGTTTIDGYSEEYRLYQLLHAPISTPTYRATAGFPIATVINITSRLRRIRAFSAEDNDGLLPFLGLSMLNIIKFGFGPKGTLKQRIESLCCMLNRSLCEEPTRFKDFSKIQNLTGVLLAAQYDETELQNLLLQILIGAELLKRLVMQPDVSYGNSITDSISSMIVAADLFMSNVKSSINIQDVTDAPSSSRALCNFRPINHQSHAQGLIKFAKEISWPLLNVANHNIERACSDLQEGRIPSGLDFCDWLYGLVPPGKMFRHRIMSALVEATPGIRYWQGAPCCESGISVQDKSYWPEHSVLGRVLGGLRHVRSTCGWIGPVLAPRKANTEDTRISGWIRLHERQVEIPTPLPRAVDPLAAFGYPQDSGYTRDQIIDIVTSPNEHITPAVPDKPLGHWGYVLKSITLAPTAGVSSPPLHQPGDAPADETYLPTLEFATGQRTVRYTLHYNSVFVAAPPCVGAHHPMFGPLARRLLRDAVPAALLKDGCPAADTLLVIDAQGWDEEAVARAWCAERGRNAIVRRAIRGAECCFACACALAGSEGLNVNVLIWSRD